MSLQDRVNERLFFHDEVLPATSPADDLWRPESSGYIGRPEHVERLTWLIGAKCTVWPPGNPEAVGPQVGIEEAITASEQSEDTVDVKNGRVAGMLAAARTVDLEGGTRELQHWQLGRHLGMLHTLASTVRVGFPMTSVALDTAAAVQLQATGQASWQPGDGDPYSPPDLEPMLADVRRIMVLVGDVALCGDAGLMIDRYRSYLDLYIRSRTVPSITDAAMLASGRRELRPNFERYQGIFTSILAYRELFMGSRPLLEQVQREEQANREAQLDALRSRRRRLSEGV